MRSPSIAWTATAWGTRVSDRSRSILSIRCGTRRGSTNSRMCCSGTAEGVQADGEIAPRNLRECEVEAVALLCCAALDLPSVEYARGYIQSWWGPGNPIPERSAQRILKVADQILKAGVADAAAASDQVAS